MYTIITIMFLLAPVSTEVTWEDIMAKYRSLSTYQDKFELRIYGDKEQVITGTTIFDKNGQSFGMKIQHPSKMGLVTMLKQKNDFQFEQGVDIGFNIKDLSLALASQHGITEGLGTFIPILFTRRAGRIHNYKTIRFQRSKDSGLIEVGTNHDKTLNIEFELSTLKISKIISKYGDEVSAKIVFTSVFDEPLPEDWTRHYLVK